MTPELERPTSIVYFSNTFARGGAEEHLLTLIRGLDARRFQPRLVCTPELAEQLAGVLPPHLEVIRLCLRRPSQLDAAARLAKLFRRERPHIVHSHLFYASLFASPIARACGVPVTIETPHVREHWRHGRWKSSYGVDRLAGRAVDYYIAVSAANARYLAEEKRVPRNKIVVIHNGCDVARFANAPEPAPALRAVLGFGPEDPVLVVIGRLEPQKGHGVLLDAMRAVLQDFPSARLVCVGDGRLASELRARAGEQGLQQAVRFVGFQSDVTRWLGLATATILPSFYEGLPLVAMESLAAARPVIATAVDGTPEIVRHGETGLTVPPGEPAQLAEAITRLLRDGELRRRLAQRGQEWVRERFDQRLQIENTQALYLNAWATYQVRSGRARVDAPFRIWATEALTQGEEVRSWAAR